MIYDFILLGISVILYGLFFYLYYRQNKAFDQIAKVVAELIENDKKIDAVDESTGADIYQLRTEFNMFKADYGDAAIEEMRQAAKREKAWADGISEIMSYGARYQGRGDTE